MAPGRVPLRNPKGTSRKARLENPDFYWSQSLEAQQRYFPYRTTLVEIVSQSSFVLVFRGVSHNYRAIRCKMGYRTDVPV